MGRSRHIEDGVGVAVIGCGTIGRLRAQVAHRHPSVSFLAVCDVDEDKAKSLAQFHDEYGAPDSTWSVLTFDGGTVANLGVSWELPEFWPAYVATMQFELFGRDGTLSVKDDHRDVLLASEKAVPSPYTPDVSMNVAMLGSAMPGDWAMGEYVGAMKDETHAFIDSVGTGRPNPILASGKQGQDVLVVSCAIDESVATGEVVSPTWVS